MAKNWLQVSHNENSIQLFWRQGQTTPRSAMSMQFEHPFNAEALAELRWYLEEYLRFPYGLEPEKAKQTEQKFQIWGQQLFDLVFSRTTKAWDFFQEATREGLDQCELNISSDDPAVLNLPWELLYSPDYQFLAPSLAGMYRSLNGYAVRAAMPELPQNRLNILLVIARPYGEKDVALKTIARPLLEVLKPIQNRVNLKVLRPPSFEQFERELNQHKGFYHIVHFDGHGDFDPHSQGFQYLLGGQGQGVLVFESQDGSPQIITAAQIAQSLTDCRVPIFMLNACKSAQEGEDSFSSVATRLVALGAKGVVAMAYSVYAEAAKHFMGRVYGQLMLGDSLSTAVAAGRRAVLNQRQRPSPKGELPLQDWLVPVLYQQETYSPFTPSAPHGLDIESFLEQSAADNLVGFPDESAYGFVGRDYDILRLERSFRQNHVVLLQGMGGVGKTQLAYGFARWLAETQGRSLCSFVSFEHGASLVNVVNEIGRAVWGSKFSQYLWEHQQQAVLNYLKAEPCLLIWDNFEPVAGFPTGNEPLLMNSEREDLKQFLKDLRGGQSWVLITSRREESWLDCGYTLQNLQGLSQADAEEFAAKILRSAGVDRAALPPEYLELFKLLNRHPLSLRVILPYLKTQSPIQIVEALHQGLDLFQGEEIEREKSLTVSLDYSVAQLSDKTRHHLPFLALFTERLNANFLSFFSNGIDTKDLLGTKKLYEDVFGENPSKQNWLLVLEEAVKAGILENKGQDIYQLHPVLPFYLRQWLIKQHTITEIYNLERRLLLFYVCQAVSLSSDGSGNSSEMSVEILFFEEPNLLRYLFFAEEQQDWNAVWSILTGLSSLYNRLGFWMQFSSLRKRLIKKIETNFVRGQPKGKDEINLWIFLQGAEAYDAMRLGNIQQAENTHHQILNELIHLNDSELKKPLAQAYFNLGIVAKEKRAFTEAANYYQRGISIFEEIEEEGEILQAYTQLGVLARLQQNFNQAEFYFNKAIQISNSLNDVYQLAEIYYELANLRLLQNQLKAASRYCQQAIQMNQSFGDRYRVAAAYDLLGIILREGQDYESSALCYKEALKIYEDDQDIYNASDEYFGLGQIAKLMGSFEDASAYFEKALEIKVEFEDWYKVAAISAEFGEMLEAQGKQNRALKFYIDAFIIDSNIAQEHLSKDLESFGRIISFLGEKQFKEIWLDATGETIPNNLYQTIKDIID